MIAASIAEAYIAFIEFVAGVAISLVFVAWPLVFAMGKALASARDTQNRLTLQSPWFFFWRTLRRWLWKWELLWVSLMIWLLGSNVYSAWSDENPTLWRTYQAIENVLWPFSFWIILFAASLILVPYFANDWVRLGVVSISSFCIHLLLNDAINRLPNAWVYPLVQLDDPKYGPYRGLYDFSHYHLWMSLGSALILIAALIRMRVMGDRWFRFEK